MKNIKNINTLKLFKMFEQIVGQLEQLHLKLGLKNGYTLTVLNFKQQFVPQKWPRMDKGVITKGLTIQYNTNFIDTP